MTRANCEATLGISKTIGVIPAVKGPVFQGVSKHPLSTLAKDLGLCKQKRIRDCEPQPRRCSQRCQLGDLLRRLSAGCGRGQDGAVGVARFTSWVAWDACPRATASPVQCPALHLERALHILEFRECANINIKQITALFLLTSHCNVAFPPIMNVGPKPD